MGFMWFFSQILFNISVKVGNNLAHTTLYIVLAKNYCHIQTTIEP
jgi:hypothetical protein